MLDLVDASSLLYRLQLEGVPIGKRWISIADRLSPHIEDHLLSFNDAHITMALLGSENRELCKQHRQSIEDFIQYVNCLHSMNDFRSASGDNSRLTREYGVRICDSLMSFNAGDYRQAVDQLAPVRQQLFHIGGSHAQAYPA
jgi:hypothetical protein